MRSDRCRQHPISLELLGFEERLQQAGAVKDAKYSPILEDILSQIKSSRHIYSSIEAHRFLQLSMLYVSARLHFNFRPSEATRFRVSASIYNAKHNLLVVKPSYLFPGSCSIRHPTILLHPDYREAPPADHQIGLSGLALLSGEVLHCTKLQGPDACGYYVRLDSESASALSVPLSRELDSAIDDFNCMRVHASGPTPHCCSCKSSLHCGPPRGRSISVNRRGNGAAIYGVLNIDCSTDDLNVRLAQRILRDKKIREVLRIMLERLEVHQSGRESYRVLRTCSTLFQLSQHTLGPRQAYVALLREISEICDGADVTLHLRDTFDKINENRSIRLVAGVGDRFRGFLIGERYRDGLVGRALEKEGQCVYLGAEEIQAALTGRQPSSYRRLMPGTALNAAMPLRFHSRVIGAINIEWHKSLMDKLLLSQSEDEYLSSKWPALIRLGSYMSLVVDYYDDVENPDLAPSSEAARDSHYTRGVTSRRRVLAYYVDSALKRLDGDLQHEPQRGDAVEHRYLHDIINASGYFLTFESKHRILASVRRLKGNELHLVHDHGFAKSRDPKKGPGAPIQVVAGQSVLGTCAQLGIPIFGTVENASLLYPDALCVKCAPKSDQDFLGHPIRYRAAGHWPVYEVGVPLVFANEIMGTFDFELFSVDGAVTRTDYKVVPPAPPLSLAGHELAPFLEWARAITFCMAYAEDALCPDKALAGFADKHRAAYRRFQRLCAQIIANVVIPEDLLTPIAGEFLRGLVPVRELKLDPPSEETNIVAQDDGGALRKVIEETQDLWWRGQYLGKLRLTLDHEGYPPRSVFSDTSLATGAGRLTHSFIVAFYSAALSASRQEGFDSKEFMNSLGSVRAAFENKIAELKNREDFGEIDPYGLIEAYFTIVDAALRDRLQPAGRNASAAQPPSRHGWFIYMTQCVEDRDLGEIAVLRCGVPFARWASMGTQEMRSLVSATLQSQDRQETIKDILGPELSEEILDAWRSYSRSDFKAASPEELEELFTEALARRVRQYPNPSLEQKPSLTTATARLQRVLSFIDLNRSPVRSARQREWFFGDKAYSVVSVPIVLYGTSIGVLQFFRRRDAVDDILFFKNDEIQAVQDFGEAIQAQIGEEVECLKIAVLRDAAVENHFPPAIQDLGVKLRERILAKKSPVIAICDFLADSAYCNAFIKEYVGNDCMVFTVDQLIKVKRPEMMRIPVVCILLPEADGVPKLKETLWALTGSVSNCITIIFISRSLEQKKLLAKMLQSPPYVVSQEDGEPAEVLKVAFGRAEGKEEGGREEIAFLFRSNDEGSWTLSQLFRDCGGSAGEVRQVSPVILDDLKKPGLILRRLLPGWYQHKEIS